jgi:hypothetical protein
MVNARQHALQADKGRLGGEKFARFRFAPLAQCFYRLVPFIVLVVAALQACTLPLEPADPLFE